MDRRRFLALSALATGAALFPVGRSGWAAETVPNAGNKRLVVILLRGAVDGLNIVVPYADQAYYDARPTIAIAKPTGDDQGVLPLDRYFGLHPALSGLMPIWSQGDLAFVHACGSPDPTRSHFDAQLFMENGTPGHARTADGWMNRLLAQMPGPHDPAQALAFTTTMPHIMAGAVNVANLPPGNAANRPLIIDQPNVSAAFDKLYANNDRVGNAYRSGQDARKQLLADMHEDANPADAGAPSPKGFAADAARLALMMRQDPRINLAFIDLGGWDTHVRQGNAKGQLADHLRQLADGLVTLHTGLGAASQDTLVLVMSEFGRTFKENGDGGTDHGHGNVMWAMGGGIRGGKVYTQWPGIDSAHLHEGRDLAVTTDFRNVIATLTERHMRLNDKQMAAIFPNMPKATTDLSVMIRA
jgi:uncharacterized protein (DUF1501 family)